MGENKTGGNQEITSKSKSVNQIMNGGARSDLKRFGKMAFVRAAERRDAIQRFHGFSEKAAGTAFCGCFSTQRLWSGR
jgi:hypothetical protein